MQRCESRVMCWGSSLRSRSYAAQEQELRSRRGVSAFSRSSPSRSSSPFLHPLPSCWSWVACGSICCQTEQQKQEQNEQFWRVEDGIRTVSGRLDRYIREVGAV